MNKVITVQSLSNGKLYIEMDNGLRGEFNMTPYMESDFFSALKNEAYFKRVGIFFHGVGWPDGQDIGPDTIIAGLNVFSETT